MMVRFSTEADVSKISTAGCGAILHKALYPKSESDLEEVSRLLSADEYVVLGGVTNTLVLEGYEGAAVFTDGLKGVSREGVKLTVGAGVKTAVLAKTARACGLGGAEYFCGLPGTVGGAISGNAGCFGSEISEFLEEVTVYRIDDRETEVLSREEIAFGYRYCNLRKNKDLILRATFAFYEEDRDKIARATAAFTKRRRENVPKGKTLGSFFKGYNGVSAGYYIEKAGLKGARVGGASVSYTHANFFLNDGGSATDYFALSEHVRKTVRKTLGIPLEREVIVVGDSHQGDR